MPAATGCPGSGCSSVGYLAQSASGHLGLLHSAKPVNAWLQDPATPEPVDQSWERYFDPDPHYADRAFRTYAALTLQAAKAHPDAIVWPETALPTDLSEPGSGRALGTLARFAKADLLVGGYDASGVPFASGSYNSVFLFDADGLIAGIYQKVQLVPFG